MTRWHETGTHPFYIAMYIHIYTHIYVHIYTSQKECLCIFGWMVLLGVKIRGSVCFCLTVLFKRSIRDDIKKN